MRGFRWFLLGVSLVLMTACGGERTTEPTVEQTAVDDSPEPGAAVEMQERVSFDGLSFQVPARWMEETSSSEMRKAQYRVPRVDGDPEDGECVWFMFPGTGGTVEANLQRWYGQFAQPDGGSTEQLAEVDRFQVGPLSLTLVDVTGTYSGGMMAAGGPKENFRMVAGIVETADAPWFLKCTGPEGTMAQAKPEVRAVLESSRP